jgi:hypothetical protein
VLERYRHGYRIPEEGRSLLGTETILHQQDCSSSHKVQGEAHIVDEQGETVAQAKHRWRISPRDSTPAYGEPLHAQSVRTKAYNG